MARLLGDSADSVWHISYLSIIPESARFGKASCRDVGPGKGQRGSGAGFFGDFCKRGLTEVGGSCRYTRYIYINV
jgi:hypothetical protein